MHKRKREKFFDLQGTKKQTNHRACGPSQIDALLIFWRGYAVGYVALCRLWRNAVMANTMDQFHRHGLD